MAKTKERETPAVPVESGRMPLAVIRPPSLLTVIEKEEDAFGKAIADQAPRTEPKSLPMATIDHDNNCWKLNGQQIHDLQGYALAYFQARAWWKIGYREGESNPPDCWSPDTIKPSETSSNKQAASCAACKFSAFGSAMGGTAKGQACKTNTFVLLVNPQLGSPPAVVMVLPPSSIRPLIGGGRSPGFLQGAKYFKDPESGKVAKYFELVWTRWDLERGGDRHCVINPVALSVCGNDDEKRALAELRGKILSAFDAVRGTVPDVATGVEESVPHA